VTQKPNFVKTKRNHISRTALRFGLVAAALVSLMVLGFSSSANYQRNPSIRVRLDDGVTTSAVPNGANLFSRFLSAFLSPPKPQTANLDQVRNGSFDNPLDPPNWVNGNAGASNAHYHEGQSIPYRLRLDNLTPGTHTVHIEWDTRHSSVNAIDYITYYDRLPDSTVLPLLGLTGTFASPVSTQIPTPGLTNAGASIATNSFLALPAGDQKFTSYNASAVSLQYFHEDDLTTAAQTSTSLTITFTADASSVVFAWGGHIASRTDWGFTNGIPNSAGGISGSPYHTRLLDLDGSGGNQDRSLSAAAVLPPAGCGIEPIGAVCGGSDTTYSSPGTQAGATYLWSITGDGAFVVNGSTTTADQTTTTVVVRAAASGTFHLTLTTDGAGFSQQTCTLDVTVNAVPVAAIAADTSACAAPTLTAHAVGGDVAGDTYLWNTGATTQSISPTTAGTYSVVITRNGCASAPASGSLCFVFQ
jgi:hypothetical protein